MAVSHDRYFLEAVASRLIELNRAFAAGLFDVRGRYSRFLEKKDEKLAGQAAYQDSLRNRVRGELDWLSRKARARTRKAQARIDEAERLQVRAGRPRLALEAVGRRPRLRRNRTEDEAARRGARPQQELRRPRDRRGLDLILSPGMRLGLSGANGSGKTTLLRLLDGEETPDAGTVEHAAGLKVVMFDQHRSRLDPGRLAQRTLAPHGDSVVFQGRGVHVAGWAKRFLFRSEQLETPVGRLSGGEQARAVLARLMLEPADLLLLDEPTNDLDIPTLEVLEESLLEFPGALVLVTHDRYLLDRVSTRILALDGRGGAVPFADCAQWEEGRAARPRTRLVRRRRAGRRRRRPRPRPAGRGPRAAGRASSATWSSASGTRWRAASSRRREARGLPRGGGGSLRRRRPPGPRRADRRAHRGPGRRGPPLRALGRDRSQGKGLRIMPTNQGAIRLFRFAGIDVFLHWSWFVVALYRAPARATAYGSAGCGTSSSTWPCSPS